MDAGLQGRWAEIERLVDEALELASGDRPGFLAQACGDDAVLREQVERLLQVSEKTAPFLETPVYPGPLAETAPPTPALLASGTRLGHYEVVRELGRGGMATVYLTQDLRHQRQVAVKVLHQEFAAQLGPWRFLREIAVIARLRHPHIVPLYDSGVAEHVLYYVMPCIEGESLRQRLTRQERLPLETALPIARQVAEALEYAHRHDVIHRDIKPENILLEHERAIVADFGIARAMSVAGDERLTTCGLALGTPAYMSPEQAAGDEIDVRSDIYSLGCVLFEMLAGRPPFLGPNARAVLARRITEVAPRLSAFRSGIPVAVDEAVARALSRAPADRFPSAADFGLAVAEAAKDTRLAGRGTPSAVVETEHSIAVLPFANFSADRENEFFADGMTDEIISALAQVPDIRVAARSSSFAFKGKDADAREIGERLNVRTLLQGSVRRVGERVRITAQLVNAADGYHLWSQTFEQTLADVFEVQDELARAIVGALKQKVGFLPEIPLVTPPTSVLGAYTAYLRARYLSNQRTVEGHRAAIPYFEQAIEHDPEFAAAHAGMSYSYALLGLDIYGGMPGHESAPKAKAAALRALALEPTLTEAHVSLGIVAMYVDHDLAGAEREFEQSLDLSPKSSIPQQWYSLFLSAMGRHEESIRVITRATTEDPLHLGLHVAAGLAAMRARRYDEAIPLFRTSLAIQPSYAPAISELARAYCHKGLFEEAVAELDRAMTTAGRLPLLRMRLGYVYAQAGRRDEAISLLEELREEASRQYVPVIYFAHILGAIGEFEEAFRYYDLAFEQGSSRLMFARTDPEWDPLRSFPWFQGLLKRLRLDF
jgi:eukaryotic-like serine/threonine-protein kinase